MTLMRPFVKATRDRFDPDGREMRRMEREVEAAIARALDKLRRATMQGVTDDNVQDMVTRLSDPAITRPFQDVVVDQLQRIALAGSEFARDTVEREVFGVRKDVSVGMWELANTAAAQWAISWGQSLVGMILATTTERIQAEIAADSMNSQTIGQLTEKVRWGYVYSEERARAIAITEVTRAYAEGNRAAWRASGVIQKRRWNTNNDEKVCPICRPLNGVVVGLDEKFPGEIDGPPGHSRCRCWVTPVVE